MLLTWFFLLFSHQIIIHIRSFPQLLLCIFLCSSHNLPNISFIISLFPDTLQQFCEIQVADFVSTFYTLLLCMNVEG